MAASTKLGLLARGFSTSAVCNEMVKTPVQVFGLDGRYATALYSAATKMKQLDNVERDLLSVQKAMKGSPKLRETIASPIVARKDMVAAIRDAGAKAKMAPATTNLLECLAENGRLKKLDNIINAFATIMAAHRGEVVCEVTTAKPLDDGQRRQLEDSLKKFLKGNETIKMTTKIDPAIIGGMVVSIGDKYVDMSIASKIKKYTEVISQAAV